MKLSTIVNVEFKTADYEDILELNIKLCVRSEDIVYNDLTKNDFINQLQDKKDLQFDHIILSIQQESKYESTITIWYTNKKYIDLYAENKKLLDEFKDLVSAK